MGFLQYSITPLLQSRFTAVYVLLLLTGLDLIAYESALIQGSVRAQASCAYLGVP
jgi:hypothetical protein